MAQFEVDIQGLAEIEGGRDPHRIAAEPIANVFDEFRGGRKQPSYCAVKIEHSANPRGVRLVVADDGAGFENEKDIWTFFGSTKKRENSGVSGRFNAGDKQLLALARTATVKTNDVTVVFEKGERHLTRHREIEVAGTIVDVLLPWTRGEERELRSRLGEIIPPDGLSYTIDGAQISRPAIKCRVIVALPTVILIDGALRSTIRRCTVDVLTPKTDATLYELGIPVCSLKDVGFPFSLDVQQKVPVPMSRDVVQPSYLYRLIGTVLEQSSLDGHDLLTEDQQGAGFVKDSLEWVRDAVALKQTVQTLCGADAVRTSSDAIANAKAAAAGAPLISGKWFGDNTRHRLNTHAILPSSKERFGGIESLAPPGAAQPVLHCPHCGGQIG